MSERSGNSFSTPAWRLTGLGFLLAAAVAPALMVGFVDSSARGVRTDVSGAASADRAGRTSDDALRAIRQEHNNRLPWDGAPAEPKLAGTKSITDKPGVDQAMPVDAGAGASESRAAGDPKSKPGESAGGEDAATRE